MTEQQVQFLHSFYKFSGAPVWILDDQCGIRFCNLPKSSASLLSRLEIYTAYFCINRSSERFAVHQDAQTICLKFSPLLSDPEISHVVIGPILLSACRDLSDLRKLEFMRGVSGRDALEVLRYLPTMSQYSKIRSLAETLILFFGQDPDDFFAADTRGSESMQDDFVFEMFENHEDILIHSPYLHETAILDCVRLGDPVLLRSAYQALPETTYGRLSAEPLKQMFYAGISNTTLVTRYAIEGGLDEETAFTLSDVYIRKMEKCNDVLELSRLNEDMALDFTQRVKRARQDSTPAYSPAVKECMKYIKKNTHQKILLSDLTAQTKLTKKYLSWLFHKETGETLTAAINRSKIEEAEYLLKYSDYSISHISHMLAFSSQSYFTSVFRQITGLTPKEYRTSAKSGPSPEPAP